MKFRPDVDGLRALSVVSVLIYHTNKNLLGGGFCGVDVFFVISGFLITGIIFRELQNNEFSFAEFYMRRLRRIQPVMWVVIFATFVVGLILFSPTDLQFLANSIRSVVSFTTNFFFASHSDYFNPNSEQYPLMHFWSLAVEEQYYLFWPLILFALFRVGLGVRAVLGVVLFLILASTIGGEVWLHQVGSAKLAYYLLPSRMGELSLGGLLVVLFQTKRGIRTGLGVETRDYLSVIGLLMLAASFLLLSDHTRFPGLWSLLPCIGAVFVIAAGPQAFINKYLLSWKPVVFVGSLSYSIYLWHFPILAYLKYCGALNLATAILAWLLTVALSIWSKFKIEDRYRRRRFSFKRAVWKFQVLPGLVALAVVIVTYDSGGLKGRFVLSKGDIVEDMNPFYPNYCHEQILERCRIGSIEKSPSFLLFGDSHANHFMPFWEYLGQKRGFSLEARSATSCAPVFAELEGDQDICRTQKHWFRKHYKEFSTIVLNARWDFLFTDTKFPAELRQQTLQALRETLSELKANHIRVFVMPQIPVISGEGYERALRKKYFLLGLFADSKNQEVRVEFGPSSEIANRALNEFLRDFPEVQVFDPVASCGELEARWPYRENGMAYRDDNHLTMKGAQELAACFAGKNLPLPWEIPP